MSPMLDQAESWGILTRAAAEQLRTRLAEAESGGPAVDVEQELAAHGVSDSQIARLRAALDDAEVTNVRAFTDITNTEFATLMDSDQRPRLGGRYEIIEPLGEGGMGKVWLAVDHQLKREVAIKAVRTDCNLITLFIDEAQITGQLQHPNIVPIHELCFDTEGQPFLVMKRVKGQSLWQLLDGLGSGRWDDVEHAAASNRAPDEAEAGPGDRLGRDVLQKLLQIFLKVCDAVAYAHSRGVLHRDLKLENIMIGEFGEVLVMDWGLAKARPNEASRPDLGIAPGGRAETRYGTIKGTLAYMAPEQAAGKTDQIDQRSDIFSLGAILYRLLTHRSPYRAEDSDDVSAVLEGRLVPPSERAPGRQIPSELEAIVLKAMHKERDARYQTCPQLKADVDAFLAGGLVGAHRYSLRQRALRKLRQHRLLVATLLGVCLLFGISWLVMELARHEVEREAEQRQQQELEDYLSACLGTLQGCDRELRDLEQGIASEPDSVVSGCDRFVARRSPAIEGLLRDQRLAQEQPNTQHVAKELLERAVRIRANALQASAARQLALLDTDNLSLEEAALQAEAGYRRFLAHRTDRGLSEPLPVAEFAYRRARLAVDAEDPATASGWVARAFTSQPQAEASGRAFLLLAESADSIERAVLQYHRALSAFGEAHSALRSEALLGLTRALASYGSHDLPTPFAPDVPPREMALRCLLRLVTPDGQMVPEVLETLPEKRRLSFSRETCALFFVLRRCSLVAFVPPHVPLDTDGDGSVDLAARWRRDEQRIELLVPEVRDKPGAQPFSLRPVGVLDLQDLLAGGSENVARVRDWQPLIFGPGHVGYCLLLEDHSAWIFNDLDSQQPALVAQLPDYHKPLEVHDLNNDGRQDLLAPGGHESGQLLAFFREADGSFSEAVEVRRPQPGLAADLAAELDVPGSAVQRIAFADLDGDGRKELALSLGLWNHFSVEIWEPQPDRSFHFKSFLRTGETAVRVVRAGEGPPRLGTFAWLGEAEERFFDIRQEPIPPLGWLELSYQDGRLQRVADPYFEPPADKGLGWLVQSPCAGRLLEIYHGANFTTLFRVPDEAGHHTPFGITGQILEIDPHSGFFHSHGGMSWRTNYRPASDADLEVLARAPIPTERRLGETPDAYAISAFLARFGLLSEAVEAARQALAQPELGPLQRMQLERLVLRSLAAQQAWPELWQELQGLEPRNELVTELLAELDTLAWRMQLRGPASELARRWQLSGELDSRGRELLGLLIARLDREAKLLDAPAIDWQNGRVRFSASEPALPLEEVVVASPGSFAAWQAQRFLSRARSGGLAWTESPQGRKIEAQPMRDSFAGVPVRFGGGPWRLVADVRIEGQPWSSALRIGLIDPTALWSGNPGLQVGFKTRCIGGNSINTVWASSTPFKEIHQGRPIDASIGRWLRLDLEYSPDRAMIRLSISDREREEVLVIFHMQVPDPAPTSGLYLLGVANSEVEEACEFELGRLALCGAAELVRRDDPELQRLFQSFPLLEIGSLLARAKLRAEPELAAEAERRLRAASASISDEATLRTLQDYARHARFDAARCALGNDPAALAPVLGAELDSEEAATSLVQWLLDQPQGGAQAPQLWEAVGRALRPWYFPDTPLEQVPGPFVDFFASIPPDHVAMDFHPGMAAVAVALAGELPQEPALAALGIEALYRSWQSEPHLAYRQVLGLAFVARVEACPEELTLPDLLHTAYGELLLANMRRAEGLAQLDPEHSLARPNKHRQAERLRWDSQDAAAALKLGARFPELP